MTDETVGGRVPQVGGGIVGRAGGAGSGGKMRPGNESGLCASGFEWDWSRSSSLTAPSWDWSRRRLVQMAELSRQSSAIACTRHSIM